MLFYLVILLSLCWSRATGTKDVDSQAGMEFDQIATASENVVRSTAQTGEKQRDRLMPSAIDATVHYENSNGFVPMVASFASNDGGHETSAASPPARATNITNWEDASGGHNSSIAKRVDAETDEKTEVDKIEDNPAYSTEARIFLNLPQSGANRRSFDVQQVQNAFELLKVKNDTPAIANYNQFYENVQNNVASENGRGNIDQSSLRQQNRERVKKVENYVNNYGLDLPQNSKEDSPYDGYYSYNTEKDKKKAIYEQEKVASNYHQQDAMSYDGHGQSASSQNGLSTSSPRTSQGVNELTRSGAGKHDENYDNVAMPSSSTQSRHRFSRPVVVAEPSNLNYNYASESRIANSEDYPTSRAIDSSSLETSNRYTIYDRGGRYRAYDNVEDSRDISDDSMDYAEYMERPKRVQKGRRRPYATETSKRLPKEHRGSLEDSLELEDQSKRYNLSRSKSHRQRAKANTWTGMGDDRKHGHDESFEEHRYVGRAPGSETRKTKSQQSPKFKSGSNWSQISPNVEISHSSGIEIGQLEKQKFVVPVKVNLVPLTSFDHAAAIRNTQSFDVSNAVLHNFVTAAPIGTVTTAAPLLSTPQTVIEQDLGLSNVPKNIQDAHNLGISTPVPDIIVGQNTFQNPMQTVLLPQTNTQNKFSANLRPQYMSSTVAPIFAVTPTLQSVPVHNVQSTPPPRATYVATSSPTGNMQHVSGNQIQSNIPHLIVPQPTLQTLSNLMQTPVQSNPEFNIQVNPHGLNGQNLFDHGSFHVHNVPAISTMAPPTQVVPAAKVNLVTAESQNKKHLVSGASANFLASASFAVGQNEQKQAVNGNSYYLQPTSQQGAKSQMQEGFYQVLKNANLTPKTKTYIQTTHIVPALFQSLPTLSTINANGQQFVPEQHSIQSASFLPQRPRDQGQQYVRLDNGMQQLQFQLQRDQMLKNAKFPSLTYQTIDNIGSHTNGNINTFHLFPSVTGSIDNAHLPSVGTKNVEIVNPNIKPSPIDTTVLNTYETMNYPTAVLTTPIPMFSATSFVTARPAIISTTTAESVSLQNYADPSMDGGSRVNQGAPSDLRTSQNQERPMFNPINFVPNMEVVKNQNALNSKLHASEPLPQNLNLVPLIPGGNYFKPSFTAQSELVAKPKLTSDLEKYAEQMFKESLKTIYNSQKWNNDRRPQSVRQNSSEPIDLAKLRSEFQRFKASLSDSKHNVDPFEAYQSENKPQTIESHRGSSSGSDQKKPDQLLAALEQVLKTHPLEGTRTHHGSNKPKHGHRHGSSDFGSSSNKEHRNTKNLREFLTPPKPHSHRSKGSIHDKPGKKRPGSRPPRFNHHNHFKGPRSHSRLNSLAPKAANLDSSATNVDVTHAAGPRYEYGDYNSRYGGHFDLAKGSTLRDSYPSLTTSIPENTALSKAIKSLKGSGGIDYMNHPRMHNLLGLLMKNKQLPTGNGQTYFRDKDDLKQFFEDEKRRVQQQFYDDNLKDYMFKSSESGVYSGLASDATGRRAFSERNAT